MPDAKENEKGSIGVFVAITDKHNKMLLVKNNNGKWGLPGGGVEQGELVDSTAKREVEEETGFKVKIARQIGVFSLTKSLGVVILFEGEITGGEMKNRQDKEISERRFFGIEEILSLGQGIYPAQLGLLRHVIENSNNKHPVYDFAVIAHK